mmetsp:Transcript_47115/g.121768  ORF Transcript_47115/g.121768 Transcript_47115/m.121768 type:complete len:102 (-) Transcript_47115:1216-1521(-)
MESYHPAADAELLSTEREECYQAAMASMDGLSRDHVSSSSVRLSILYEWVHVVLEMRQHAKKVDGSKGRGEGRREVDDHIFRIFSSFLLTYVHANMHTLAQ